jgi:dTMP kinase
MFITVEGPDFSGKTTQVGVMKNYFESLGRQVVVSKEPGGTDVGTKIREILVKEDYVNDPLSVSTQILLLLASRIHHVNKVILPALRQGKIVISDRYIDSTYVYQGLVYKHKDFIEKLLEIDKLNYLATRPDYTFFYDIDYDTSIKRANERGISNDLDSKYASLKEKPLNCFKEHFIGLDKTYPSRIKMIDGTGDIDTVKKCTTAACREADEHYTLSDDSYLLSMLKHVL